jgi:hypothetical protein
MTHRTFARILTTALVALALPMAAAAAEKKPLSCSADPLVNKLKKGEAQAIEAWLGSDKTGKPVAYSFKSPSIKRTGIMCKLNAEGLRCFEVLVDEVCPTQVEVDTPAGRSSVPVDCTGPNGDGTCDCDFAQG